VSIAVRRGTGELGHGDSLRFFGGGGGEGIKGKEIADQEEKKKHRGRAICLLPGNGLHGDERGWFETCRISRKRWGAILEVAEKR